MIDFDELKAGEHDSWSTRDALPREPVHQRQRLLIYADHLRGGREFDCTQFRVDPKGSLVLMDRGNLVTAFAPGSWQSFEALEIPADDDELTAPDSSL